MSEMIAEVIVNISVEELDRGFDYLIPETLQGEVREGTPVIIPFGRGNRQTTGYVVRLKDKSDWDELKSITCIKRNEVPVEGQLLGLAAWIREYYGSTMSEAIRTVLPVRARVKSVEEHWLNLIISDDEARRLADEEDGKHHTAKARLLRALIDEGEMATGRARREFKTTTPVIDGLRKAGVISVSSVRRDRRPEELKFITDARSGDAGNEIVLNEEQRLAVDRFVTDFDNDIRTTYLLYGVTGSGKTEVYMEILDHVISSGLQAIVLIPEIALTHQTVERFSVRFGDRVSVIHSRMSAGERYDQFIRAKNHEVDIVVGPRSALFAPFDRLGLIVIDEEHEGSYRSEKNPTYHAVTVALERAKRSGASVVLGSATPSVHSYLRAKEGKYTMLRLNSRAGGAALPQVYVADMREELKAGNRSILSRVLREKIADRLESGEQTMLFINRRGYAGFVSCRSCGYVIKCNHCDVSLTEHRRRVSGAMRTGGSDAMRNADSYLLCHYCGSYQPMPAVCPECGSPYIAAFGLGTEKVVELIQKEFPSARIMRMDADTTKNKGGHEKVLAPFRNGEADILVGTQMIVKGHDMPRVTLVGAIAADLSLYQSDYTSGERTYQLLRQAGGRAGRGELPGEFVIQTYQPDSYCIRAVAEDDDGMFYDKELAFRKVSGYPPYMSMLRLRISSADEDMAKRGSKWVVGVVEAMGLGNISLIGPAPEGIYFVKDRYRMVIHVKTGEPDDIDRIMRRIDEELEGLQGKRGWYIDYNRL